MVCAFLYTVLGFIFFCAGRSNSAARRKSLFANASARCTSNFSQETRSFIPRFLYSSFRMNSQFFRNSISFSLGLKSLDFKYPPVLVPSFFTDDRLK